jgi:hypothetical protein
MKHILTGVFFFLIFGLPQYVNAQENCKVLVPQIDSIYTGKCKNGLANGKGTAIGIDSFTGFFSKGWPVKGTYTWAGGNSYTGDLNEGKRNGEGKLTIKLADRDSILNGLWENDKYLGPKPNAPRVIIKYNIDSYNYKKVGDTKMRVLINLTQNGSRNATVSNLRIDASSGTETAIGNLEGFENITFPVIIKVSYTTMNKIKTMTLNVNFEFEISEPGDWVVDIAN